MVQVRLKENKVLTKSYSWENLTDIEEDIFYALNDYAEEQGIPAEFTGRLVVTVTYEEDKNG